MQSWPVPYIWSDRQSLLGCPANVVLALGRFEPLSYDVTGLYSQTSLLAQVYLVHFPQSTHLCPCLPHRWCNKIMLFSYRHKPRPGFEPTSAEVLLPGTFVRGLYRLSYRAAAVVSSYKTQSIPIKAAVCRYHQFKLFISSEIRFDEYNNNKNVAEK